MQRQSELIGRRAHGPARANGWQRKQRSITAVRIAKHLLEFQSCLFMSGQYADLYGMPPGLDANVAGFRLSLDTVRVPMTDARRMAQALHHHKADSRHATVTPDS